MMDRKQEAVFHFNELTFMARINPKGFESTRRAILDQFIEEQLHDSSTAVAHQSRIDALRQPLAPHQCLDVLAAMLRTSLHQLAFDLNELDKNIRHIGLYSTSRTPSGE